MLESKKILHVIRSEAWGGLELYVDILIKKMHYDGQNVAVYCLPNSIIGRSLINAGIPIIAAKKKSKYSIIDILRIRNKATSVGFSIVHSHTNIDAWSCAVGLKGLNSIKHIFSLYMGTMPKRDWLHMFIYQKIDLLLSTSEEINREVCKNYPISPAKVHLMRYGREIDSYSYSVEKRNEIRNKYGDDSKVVVGTMCRIDPTKGVKEFAMSFLDLSPENKLKTVFWIIGERTILHLSESGEPVFERQSNELYEWLIEFIKTNQLENSIRLIPYQKDFQAYLSALDVFVLASYNEMYALVVLDALLMKIPVIGTNKGGTPEQLTENRGLVVSTKSSKEISKAIDFMILNPEKAQSMGQNGRNWVMQEHDWKNVLPKYYNYYQLISK